MATIYTGSFSVSGSINDPADQITGSLVGSGTLTADLTFNSSGNITGTETISGSGTATVTEVNLFPPPATFTDTESFPLSGAFSVSGTTSGVSFSGSAEGFGFSVTETLSDSSNIISGSVTASFQYGSVSGTFELTPTVTLPTTAPSAPLPSSGEGVVIFGDTPMLLEETANTIPAQAAFTLTNSGQNEQQYGSPVISANLSEIGTLQVSGGPAAAWQIVTEAVENTATGMAGELGEINGMPTWVVDANDARDVGTTIEQTAAGVMAGLQDAVSMLTGQSQMTLEQWESLHGISWLEQQQATYNGLAGSQVASQIPGVGWVLAPVVNAYFKLSYLLQGTSSPTTGNSAVDQNDSTGAASSDASASPTYTSAFQVSVSAASTLTANGGVLIAGNQNNNIDLLSGNNFVTTGNGENTITAQQPGNNFIAGGAGMNTLVLNGDHSNYTITQNSDGSVSVTSATIDDQIVDVGYLQFADHTTALADNNNVQLAALYQAGLGRSPDAGGLQYWENIYISNIPASAQAQGVYVALSETSGNYNG